MNKIPLNIVEFVRHREVLNDQCHSETQVAILKSLYGLHLNPSELAIYREHTGRTYEEGKELREITIIAGRRSGKTVKIAVPIVCFEAFRRHGLKPGEEGVVMLLARTLEQARIAFRAVRRYLRGSRVLSKRIVSTARNEIKLDNGITIACYASTYDGVRGRTIVAVVCDEFAFWPSKESSADSDAEVIAALRPGMSTVHNPKLIKISTPYAKCGVLWDDFQHRSELSFPVWQVNSIQMNPTIDMTEIENERRRDEENCLREYFAEFTDSVKSWIDSETLDLCIVRGRTEVLPRRGARYVAAIDPATRHNDFALVIVELSVENKVIQVLVRRWRGTKKAPLPYERVLGEIKSILDQYEINTVIGDQHCCDAIAQHLLKLGIIYEVSFFSQQTRAKIFTNLKHRLGQGTIELLDEPTGLGELRSLQLLTSERGQTDVRSSPGLRDDSAVALALAVNEATKLEGQCPPPIHFPSRDFDFRPVLRMIPGSCPYEAVCGNYPRCFDEGCLGFNDQRSVVFARELAQKSNFQ
jgi:hypothetical protein